MLMILDNKAVGLAPVIVANTEREAIERMKRITRIMTDWAACPFKPDTMELQDMAIESVEAWWGDYCDYADGNDDVKDAEFDEVTGWMKSTFDAIFKG